MFVQESAFTGCVRSGDQTPEEVSCDTAAPTIAVSNPLWKRITDFALILLFLPIWLPLMAIVAIGIKLVSRGPVFFRQERIGHRGKTFLCLKFRSMRCDAEIQSHKQHLRQLMKSGQPMVKLDQRNDPRLIPLGQLLRASALDELPQLFNVLRGQMSLVGPRPCTVYEYEQYQVWQRERFAVLPGMTGLWQVTGKNKTTFDQMIRLDIRYGRHLSFRHDAWILLKTFRVVLEQISELFSNKLKKAQPLLSKNDPDHEKDQTTTC
jgi:lipopolysaccharide/colanic/teichoic acid biosynthesis glycosyltransferase